jgi:hypothetical protein
VKLTEKLLGMVLPVLRSATELAGAILREVFDESAYTRFLQRNEAVSSRKSYAAFLLENDRIKARRPRCC